MKKKCGMSETLRKKVFICSPFRATAEDARERKEQHDMNVHLARAACRMAVEKGCFPLASHLYFPAFLDDETPEERRLGIQMGLNWLRQSDEVWVMGPKITDGMAHEIAEAMRLDKTIRYFSVAIGNVPTLHDLLRMILNDSGNREAQ